MKAVLRIAFAILICFVPSFAQGEYVAGGAYFASGYPVTVTGWAAYARSVSGDRVYAIGMLEVLPTKAEDGQYRVEGRYSSGAAIRLLNSRFGTLFALADGGAATSENGTSLAGAAGALFVTKIRKDMYFYLPVRFSNTTSSTYRVTIGIGLGWGKASHEEGR